MRPPLISGGNTINFSPTIIGSDTASMRPPLISGGNHSYIAVAMTSDDGFNEAPAN